MRLSKREKRIIFVEGVASGIAFTALTIGVLIVVKEEKESGLRSKRDRVETCSVKIECLNFVIAIRKADELLSTLEEKS